MFRIRERIEYRQTKNSPSIEDESAKQIDILKFISSTHRTEFYKRRDTEWGVIFPALTLYVAAACSGISGNNIAGWKIWVVSILFAFITSAFLWFIHRANAINKEFARLASDALIKLSGDDKLNKYMNEINNKCDIFTCTKGRWSFFGESVTIFFFAIISALIMTSK
ncbi:MAG: hypothetical protein LLG42_15090 [Chloroflexi bacterium]|nr:hypothetical protein [Chloroflexota bacterium]